MYRNKTFCVHVHKLHPGENLHPGANNLHHLESRSGCNFAPGCKSLKHRSHGQKYTPGAILHIGCKLHTRTRLLWDKGLGWRRDALYVFAFNSNKKFWTVVKRSKCFCLMQSDHGRHSVANLLTCIKNAPEREKKNDYMYRVARTKTCLEGFRSGPKQTGLCNHRRWLET